MNKFLSNIRKDQVITADWLNKLKSSGTDLTNSKQVRLNGIRSLDDFSKISAFKVTTAFAGVSGKTYSQGGIKKYLPKNEGGAIVYQELGDEQIAIDLTQSVHEVGTILHAVFNENSSQWEVLTLFRDSDPASLFNKALICGCNDVVDNAEIDEGLENPPYPHTYIFNYIRGYPIREGDEFTLTHDSANYWFSPSKVIDSCEYGIHSVFCELLVFSESEALPNGDYYTRIIFLVKISTVQNDCYDQDDIEAYFINIKPGHPRLNGNKMALIPEGNYESSYFSCEACLSASRGVTPCSSCKDATKIIVEVQGSSDLECTSGSLVQPEFYDLYPYTDSFFSGVAGWPISPAIVCSFESDETFTFEGVSYKLVLLKFEDPTLLYYPHTSGWILGVYGYDELDPSPEIVVYSEDIVSITGCPSVNPSTAQFKLYPFFGVSYDNSCNLPVFVREVSNYVI